MSRLAGYKKIEAAMEQAKKEGLLVSFSSVSIKGGIALRAHVAASLPCSVVFKPFLLDPTLPVDHSVSKRYDA